MKKIKQHKLIMALALVSISFCVSAENQAEQITGSRLAQIDASTALPVTVYTREDILQSGESNAADFIRNLPVNSFGSFRPRSGSSAQSVSTIDIRGLGSSRSLVLIDGRRLGKGPTIGSAEDLNMIPMGAVERIEILMDGASAIYGSDAHSGVINVITRKEFQGLEIMLGGAESSIPRNGGEREEGSVVFGTSSDRSSLLASVSWNDREFVLNRDLPWTWAGNSLFGNNYTTVSNGYDDGYYMAIPGGCDFPGTGFIFNSSYNACFYNFELHAADEASIENKSFYSKATHQITDHWLLSANAAFRQTESYGQFAPVPGTSAFAGEPLTVNSPNNPTNPNSPNYDADFNFDPVPVNWWHRFDALGNRESTVTNQQLDFSLELDGDWLGAEWNFGVRHLDNRSEDVGRNYVILSAAAALIESGDYNLADPYGAPDSVLNAIRTTIYRDAKYDSDEYFASAQFNWLDIPAGQISSLIGVEYRKDKYQDLYDPQSEAGQVLGSAGNSAGINRAVKSVFFESLVPIHRTLDLRLALRNDDYSLKGDSLNSHLSFRYQPIENLSFRLSYSENSKPPELDTISQKPTPSATTVRDPLSCINQGFDPGCNAPVLQVSYGNPSLDSEHSTQKHLGVSYELNNWFQASFDVFDLSIDNRIRSYSANGLVSIEINGGILPPGLGCERSPAGSIIRCFVGFGNGGRVDFLGANFELDSNYGLFGGQVHHRLNIGFVEEVKIDDLQNGRNLVSDPGNPQSRATLLNSYQIGNWQFSLQTNFIDKQNGSVSSLSVYSWVTHDVQINYQTPWQGRFTIGAQNVGEKSPPIRRGLTFRDDYDPNLYNGFGRIVYARYTHTF